MLVYFGEQENDLLIQSVFDYMEILFDLLHPLHHY